MQHRKKFQVKLPEEQPRRKRAPYSTPRALGCLPPDLTVPQGGFAPTPTLISSPCNLSLSIWQSKQPQAGQMSYVCYGVASWRHTELQLCHKSCAWPLVQLGLSYNFSNAKTTKGGSSTLSWAGISSPQLPASLRALGL